MNILSLGSHGVLEYDQVKLWTDIGYDVFSPGGYEAPREPGERLRPAIPTAPDHPDLRARCIEQREKHAADDWTWAIDWAKADLHPDIVDWADTVIVDCYPDRWIGSNWAKIRGKRVIWRTIGQSSPDLEEMMLPYRRRGVEIVRYSPAERRAFEPIGAFAGEDAVIRFAKDPADWYGWTGEDARVLNFTQHNREPHSRDEWVNWGFWEKATEGLPTVFGGPNSELVGGIGSVDYDQMRALLRSCRAYLYTGTRPASYTLGLIEAMMTGIPVVSIGPVTWGWPALFEAHELTYRGSEDPKATHGILERLLRYPDPSPPERTRAIQLFGVEAIAPQWVAFLGAPVAKAEAVA